MLKKGQTSHPPNPGAPRRALSQARPQPMKAPEAYLSHRPPRLLAQLYPDGLH